MVDIEPCWWCGRDAKSQWFLAKHWVGCSDKFQCGARGPCADTPEAAIAAWNRVAGDRWRPVPLPDDRRDVMVHVKPGRGATHWRRVTEPPEPPPIQTSGYVEVTGKEPLT